MSDAGRVVVVGTAGHVDHGKSTLVRALTGTDPDRLAEEKARGLTIDLGYAHLTLPGGAVASFVDVPGHEDFIRNMLAGAGGISSALLVVAADEGPMPQTREHLAILDLLGIGHGVVALTKIDAADSADWIDLVEADVLELLDGTSLQGSPTVRVSAQTGEGLDGLVQRLAEMLRAVPSAPDSGVPRLAVDRSFTIAGFGTVVTGALRDGSLDVGDEIEVFPHGYRARVRGIQMHGLAVDRAEPGVRIALNLAGVEVSDIPRGTWIGRPGSLPVSRLVDVAVRVVRDAAIPLKHDMEVIAHAGAGHGTARVRLIGADTLAAGEEGFAQLVLSDPTPAFVGDRLVLRRPSPPSTLGGCTVLDVRPRRRWPRFRESASFDTLARGDPSAQLRVRLERLGFATMDDLGLPLSGRSGAEIEPLFAGLERTGHVHRLGQAWLADSRYARLKERAVALLTRYHGRYPLRAGAPREEVRGRLGIPSQHFAAWLDKAQSDGWLALHEDLVRLASFAPRLADSTESLATAVVERFRAGGAQPPSLAEARDALGREAVAFLLQRGDLVAVNDEIAFDSDTYHRLLGVLKQGLSDGDGLSVAEIRDLLGTSRKYVLALLEHTDRERITRREGDLRRLGRSGAG